MKPCFVFCLSFFEFILSQIDFNPCKKLECTLNLKKIKIITLKLILAYCLLIFTACGNDSIVGNIKTEELFSLKYGSFEDEFHLYTSDPDDYFSSVVMRDGFFYIADSASKKVSQFSSYGDLVSVFYNQESNPVPSFVQLSDLESAPVGIPTEAGTKRATEYPFNKVTAISSDSRQYLYVIDYLPEERYETDAETGILLRQVVLRFSADGTYIDYIGQQGPGGIPFPTIKNIYTTNNNELITLCLSTDKYIVYWFDEDGFLKYTIPFYFDQLPSMNNDSSVEAFISIGNIVPDYNEQKLYIKVDYSFMAYDSSSQVQSGINYEKTYLYPFNIITEQYEEPIVIPSYEETIASEYSKEVYQIPYDFLGVTDSGWFFFYLADSNGYSILMVAPKGEKIIKRHLNIETDNLVYYNLSLSNNGIIIGLLSDNQKTSIVWWRTDSIIENFLAN